VAREMSARNGKLRLIAAGNEPSTLQKNHLLPGSITDFTVTPFAVVIGTVSKDPEMVRAVPRQGLRVHWDVADWAEAAAACV